MIGLAPGRPHKGVHVRSTQRGSAGEGGPHIYIYIYIFSVCVFVCVGLFQLEIKSGNPLYFTMGWSQSMEISFCDFLWILLQWVKLKLNFWNSCAIEPVSCHFRISGRYLKNMKWLVDSKRSCEHPIHARVCVWLSGWVVFRIVVEIEKACGLVEMLGMELNKGRTHGKMEYWVPIAQSPQNQTTHTSFKQRIRLEPSPTFRQH